jgi:tetratricopeptide (TPR) repeat protein
MAARSECLAKGKRHMQAFETPFPDQMRLLSRLAGAIRRGDKLSFLIGSALTAPNKDTREPGVLSVGDIIKKTEEIFLGTEDHREYLSLTEKCRSTADKYQNAMRFLLETHGQQSLNAIIQESVLNARTSPPIKTLEGEYEKLEDEVGGWHLRPAIKVLGELITSFPQTFSNPTLTTNFDPLLKISIRKAGGEAQAVALSGDGLFDNVSGGSAHRIIHFHGYWHGSDTLHTPLQLKRLRPKLKGCLRDHLSNNCLVVMGYGGWDDVFTKTLLEIIAEERSKIDVIWCFYSNNDDEIRANTAFFAAVEPALHGRLMIYKGIDCHDILPKVYARALQEKDEVRAKDLIKTIQVVQPEASASDIANHTQAATVLTVTIDSPDITPMELECDSPPSVSTWVGRNDELKQILHSQASVVAITGMGGKGKSMLASKFIRDACANTPMLKWDWRDLKEEGNTIQKEIFSAIYRITKGRLKPAMFVGANNDVVVKNLLKAIGDNAWLLVFDNVDHYIDMDGATATGILDALIKEILQSQNSALRLIITCRPNIEYLDSRFLEISMSGFSLEETRELCKLRNVRIESTNAGDIEALHSVTEGHPLWINLIATQVGKGKATIRAFLDKIQRGKSTELPLAMLQSIWSTLNDKQKFVLRCMAELTHPESEDRIGKYLSSRVNWNQFSKAIRALRSLNLIIVRSLDSIGADEKLELHPLIREFVHSEYSHTERREFIEPIVRYFREKLVGAKPRSSIPHTISVNTLEVWTIKADLESNVGMTDDAMDTLLEAHHSMLMNGLGETFVRISDKIISHCDWLTLSFSISENSKFFKLTRCAIRTLTELGRYSEADSLLDKMSHTISDHGISYVHYCAERCYSYWIRKSYDQAIYWGEEGMKYTARLHHASPRNECENYLALARRDSQKAGEVDKALEYFLAGRDLAKLLGHREVPTNVNGSDFGNLGRCLFFKGELDDALYCYAISAAILFNGNHLIEHQNRGYASLWLGEVLEQKHDTLNAYLFYRLAVQQFSTVLAVRAEIATERANALASRHSILMNLASVEQWRIQQSCSTWLNDYLNRLKSNENPVRSALSRSS